MAKFLFSKSSLDFEVCKPKASMSFSHSSTLINRKFSLNDNNNDDNSKENDYKTGKNWNISDLILDGAYDDFRLYFLTFTRIHLTRTFVKGTKVSNIRFHSTYNQYIISHIQMLKHYLYEDIIADDTECTNFIPKNNGYIWFRLHLKITCSDVCSSFGLENNSDYSIK